MNNLRYCLLILIILISLSNIVEAKYSRFIIYENGIYDNQFENYMFQLGDEISKVTFYSEARVEGKGERRVVHIGNLNVNCLNDIIKSFEIHNYGTMIFTPENTCIKDTNITLYSSIELVEELLGKAEYSDTPNEDSPTYDMWVIGTNYVFGYTKNYPDDFNYVIKEIFIEDKNNN